MNTHVITLFGVKSVKERELRMELKFFDKLYVTWPAFFSIILIPAVAAIWMISSSNIKVYDSMIAMQSDISGKMTTMEARINDVIRTETKSINDRLDRISVINGYSVDVSKFPKSPSVSLSDLGEEIFWKGQIIPISLYNIYIVDRKVFPDEAVMKILSDKETRTKIVKILDQYKLDYRALLAMCTSYYGGVLDANYLEDKKYIKKENYHLLK